MILDANIPSHRKYKIYDCNGTQIIGVQYYNTESKHIEMALKTGKK